MNTALALKSGDIESGDRLVVFFPGAEAPRAVAEPHLQATVMAATPKAVRVQLEAARGAPRNLWIPRRALTHLVRDRLSICGTLARWWIPDDRQAAVLASCTLASTTPAKPRQH